jgi:uncharacterized protein (TIRG00374 family)
LTTDPRVAPQGENGARGRWSVGRVLFLFATALCLYLFLPSIAEVFRAWDHLGEIHPAWVVAIVACEMASFVCVWVLQGITLHTRDVFVVSTTHLAGNAFNRVTPGGGATGTALQARLLADAGYPLAFSVSALTVWSILSSATVVALPVFTIPAIVSGTRVAGELLATMGIGAVVFVLLLGVGALFLFTQRPVELFAHAVERVVRVVRPHAPLKSGFTNRVLAERNTIREMLGARWPEAVGAALGRWAFDFLALFVALYALGAGPAPFQVLLAYVSAQVLGLIPITPGGLGFVEAGLTGTLVLAGVPPEAAVVSTLAYRLVSFWLPLPIGFAAAQVFRRRYPRSGATRA